MKHRNTMTGKPPVKLNRSQRANVILQNRFAEESGQGETIGAFMTSEGNNLTEVCFGNMITMNTPFLEELVRKVNNTKPALLPALAKACVNMTERDLRELENFVDGYIRLAGKTLELDTSGDNRIAVMPERQDAA